MRKKALLLFAELFTIGGIQQYNRHLYCALKEQFPNHQFIGLSLYDLKKNEKAEKHNDFNDDLSCLVSASRGIG